MLMQLASSQKQVATLSMVIDNVRAEASNAVRELREGLAAEQRRTESLQSLIASGGRGETKNWNLVSSKEFAGADLLDLVATTSRHGASLSGSFATRRRPDLRESWKTST